MSINQRHFKGSPKIGFVNCLRTPEMPLINWKTNLMLNWFGSCVNSTAPVIKTFITQS